MIDSLIDRYEKIVEQIYEIASDEKTDPNILAKLSKLTDMYILNALFCNPNTPNSVLDKALKDYSGFGGMDEEIRIHIVYNKGINIAILKRLSMDDPSHEVREAALTSYIQRVANDPSIKHDEISKLRELIENKIVNKNRQTIALNALKKHPNF